MKVLITGTSCGMGEQCALKFLSKGHEVIGIDILPAPSSLSSYQKTYTHYICNISSKSELPNVEGVEILINNAGVWNSGNDIEINLRGTMNCTEKYALYNMNIKSVLNQCDILAMRGSGFPGYVASKGGIYAYTKWTAKQIAKYGATCNSLSFGGVLTEMSDPVLQDSDKWNRVMEQTPLQKWVSAPEAAEWMYFLTYINKSCSGQDIVIDNLESLNGEFVW